jgi:hypothetical protein
LVNCVLGLAVSPEEGGSLLQKSSMFLSAFMTTEKVLVPAADITQDM